jgi:DNA polymerase III gamma/tau subunit
MLLSGFGAQQSTLDYPLPLSEKYRPKRINQFVGLEREKKILSAFCARPMPGAWLFVGPSGIGKTSMALAMATELGAEVHHIPSQKCTVDNVDEVIRMCWYVAYSGGFHVVIVDEADQMSNAAQLAFLSKLDSTAMPPKTIFVFTCNAIDRLEKRFLSRCRTLEFSSYGMREKIAGFLAEVWEKETGKPSTLDFEGVSKNSCNNVRDALSVLEIEILAA